MAVQWTKEQQKVIEIRDHDVLVSAAAGSGKTAVLVQRIIGKVTDPQHPVDIDKMLVVTFTAAAAAEMRERILAALEQALERDPLNRHLLRQVTLVHSAQITTIHSFCMYVIRNHFLEIDLDPVFRMAEEGEITLMMSEVLDRVLEEEYRQQREGFLRFMDAYAIEGRDRGVRDMIMALYRFSESYPWPKQWLRSLQKPFAAAAVDDMRKDGWMEFVCSLVRAQIADVRDETAQLLRICERPDGPACYGNGLKKDLAMYDELLAASDYPSLQRRFSELKYSVIGSSRGFAGDPERLEAVKGARNDIKKMVTKIREDFFGQTPEQVFAVQARQLPYVEELIFLTVRFMDAFTKQKRKKNVLDFGDLEHLALQILVDEETGRRRPAAEAFVEHFDEIMVDEYQDSNYIQEAILTAISKDGDRIHNRFMVGDVKQSIYRFRLARPEIFMEKYQSYAACDGPGVRIDLRTNFRSRPEVLEFANDIFYPLMQRDLGRVAYDAQAALYPGAQCYPPREGMFAPQVLIGDWEEDELELPGVEDKGAFEAKMVAERIRAMKEAQMVTDAASGCLRPMRYSDVVILMRSPKSIGDTFAEVLSENGIPAHMESSTGYFTSMEVETALQLLQVLDNPMQDIPLAAVLHSPMFSFSNEELAWIRKENEDAPFHRAFFAYAAEHGEDEKVRAFTVFLKRMRGLVCDTPIHALLEQALTATGFMDYVTALPQGAGRRENLERLIDEAVAYEHTNYQGLPHFVNYINHLQKYEVDFGGAAAVGENGDAVRIMSIHKSKGLEFPIVFVCGLGRQFNRQDSRQLMALHGTYGMAFDEIDAERHVRSTTMYKKALARALDMDALGEEIRILYVALTRAKEKIILTGTCAKAMEKCSRWRQGRTPIPLWKRMYAKTFLEWIVMALSCYPDKYQIETVTPGGLAVSDVAQETGRILRREELGRMEADEALSREIDRGLAYTYPHRIELPYKNKYSVSEIKHKAMEKVYLQKDEAEPMFLAKEREPFVPAFISQADTGAGGVWRGALRGTATHRYMECFDFAREGFAETFACQLAEMMACNKLKKEQEALLPKAKIERFLKSGMAERMSAAARGGRLFVEKPFVMGSTPQELFGEENDSEEWILVQGIIDVFFQEEDGIVLLDYKTDRVTEAGELRERYASQMQLYAAAIEKTMGVSVKQRYLYAFSLEELVEI